MQESGRVRGRRWIFADCEYLELSRHLRVRGELIRIESKPLDVLQVLLERPAEVLTKDQLLGEAWEAATSDQSLATAVSKLRKAFGGVRDRVLLSMPGIGYRMAVPVVCFEDRAQQPPDFELAPGDAIPMREQWHAVRALDVRNRHNVWVAEQRRTGEQRVFKFATDGIRLRALQREVALSRLFAASFPSNPHFVRIFEWNFESAPFFTEAPFAGRNLFDFVHSPELTAMSNDARARLVAQIARAVADAHSIGVLHNDLKPSNILVVDTASYAQADSVAPADRWQIRVVDFGIAVISDLQRLQDLEITYHGEFADEAADPERPSSRGSANYLAPELRQLGAQPDTRADIFALGVILFQVLCGDMYAPLSLGWEGHVADPSLREDIEGACQLDPDRRFSSAAELASRLERLPERRADRQQLEQERQDRLDLEQALMRARLRQPWIIATAAALLLGVCGTAWFFVRATQERNEAVQRGEALASLNRFLTVDLLGQANPDASAHPIPAQQVTLLQAINQARSNVDRRFGQAPSIAARIHLTLAGVYSALSSFGDSEQEYRAAAERFEQADGNLSQDALQARLRHAIVLAIEQTPQGLAASQAELAELQPRLQAIRKPSAELQGWEAMADSGQIMMSNDPAIHAISILERAIQRGLQTPGFDPALLSAMQLRISGVYLKADRGEDALKAAREGMAAVVKQQGPDSPTLNSAKLFVEEALFVLHRYPEVEAASAQDYAQFLRTYGPISRYTLSALDMHAQSEGALGRFADSTRDWITMYEATHGNPSMQFFSETSIVSAGLEECHRGAYLQGEDYLERGLREISAQGGLKALNYSVGSLTLAECLLAQQEDGQSATTLIALERVRQLLGQVDLNVLTTFSGMGNAQADLSLAEARLAFREGDLSKARKLAVEARTMLNQPGSDPWEMDRLVQLEKGLSSHGS